MRWWRSSNPVQPSQLPSRLPPANFYFLCMSVSVRNDQRHLMDSAGDVCYEVGSGISRYQPWSGGVWLVWMLCVGVSQCYVSKVAPINYISSPPSISAPKDCQGLSVNRDFKNTDRHLPFSLWKWPENVETKMTVDIFNKLFSLSPWGEPGQTEDLDEE